MTNMLNGHVGKTDRKSRVEAWNCGIPRGKNDVAGD
jgi:hypothetical protein